MFSKYPSLDIGSVEFLGIGLYINEILGLILLANLSDGDINKSRYLAWGVVFFDFSRYDIVVVHLV